VQLGERPHGSRALSFSILGMFGKIFTHGLVP
jgi:hypothetical protein